ncbi:MAG: glycosyltransferase [Saprospiraceae bacterium]|nr:glycosyltransferase [Saprospiraceae bacterium]
MKVLIIGYNEQESFGLHIKEGLHELGHDCDLFDLRVTSQIIRSNKLLNKLYDLYRLTEAGEENICQRIIIKIKEYLPDIILTTHDFLTPKQLKDIKNESNALLMMWFPDHIGNFGRAFFINGQYDYLFFKDRNICNILNKEYGLNAFYIPECANTKRQHKADLSVKDKELYDCDICTVGTMHTSRINMLNNFTEYNVKIWGPKPKYWAPIDKLKPFIMNRYVSYEEKNKAFLGAKIVLNSLYPTEIDSVNVRLFEVAAAGAFQLINYREVLNDLYDTENEIATFKDRDELIKKVKHYISDDSLRQSMSQRAYWRTITYHKYTDRLQTIFNTMNGIDSGYIKLW